MPIGALGALELEARAMAFMFHLHARLRTPQKQPLNSLVERAQTIHRVLDSWRDNLTTNWSVADGAQAAEVSERTFRDAVIQVTGHAPHRWLQIQRLSAAEELIRTAETAITLDEVAQRVGLSGAAQLRRLCTTMRGHPPSAWRS